MLIIKYIILALTYLGLGLGYLPALRMNRATIAMTGSAFMVALGVLNLSEAWRAIDPGTIIFLLGMMVVNSCLGASGFFQLALGFFTRFANTPLGILAAITFGSGILSALFLNDTTAILLTPLTITLCRTLAINPLPYLLALAGGTNLGSVATLSGNPQNILIGSLSKISYLEFASYLTPVALICLVIQIGWLYWLYPEVRSVKPFAVSPQIRYRLYKPLLVKSLVVTIGLLIAFVAGAPLAESAWVAATFLFITRRLKPQRILKAVDWDLLIMFAGLFVITKATQKLGILDDLTDLVQAPLSLLGVTVVLSNLISNVPAVLVLQSLISPDDTKAWLLLAAGSTLAGNLTLLGSVANLIVAELGSKQGYRLSFKEHFRFGLPLTLVTLAIAYFWIY
ncbi:anion transporter [[Phormidium ambiguum] IAM M-71]|uniref:Anion transporter n=1 Tax=[Phormidium ambiguum] IAM M-71 TaxID=454136 RepID=A0A1U7INZ7_9CYAN|nr:anion transporter [Phormidium ambiguum]OKH39003.1 anion transporter [Phormidium ambiguum IAM M-71]